jgi:hypothetical protein
MKAACLAMLAAAWCLPQSGPPSEVGSIRGSVTSIAGEPLRRVTLRLNPLPAGRGLDSAGASSIGGPVSGYATPGRRSH